MSKHTPGPWYRSGKTVYALNGQGFNRFSALVQDAHTGDEELEANARLIAAAPELLEALQDAVDQLKCNLTLLMCDDEFIDLMTANARHVIAKALGEDEP